ncbi:UvrD-helicase domain-containing protein [Pseudoclavibacter soli]|uniref:UvrD-helicase domain-containing protein n=1 Tax=Pseudoclavibacter soli TaxID=452623 RepID=UPI0003FAD8E5|nr:UvrD-helicase domain-containing protein [Pseudoclavibacter soli]
MNDSDLHLTAEQACALDVFLKKEALTIEACAGAGKTTLLRTMAEHAAGRGLYLAYNAHTARDARGSFPDTAEVRTPHSIAYEHFGRARRQRLTGKLPGAKERKEVWGAAPFGSDFGRITSWQVMHLGLNAVEAFCQSVDQQLGVEHVVIPQTVLYELSPDERTLADLNDAILHVAKKIWETANDLQADTPVTHDMVLKMWALTNPVLDADYVLFDEAQDANPVIVNLLKHQSAQIVTVGDSAQQLYGWRGAVDALASFDGVRQTLTQSFRFGQAIADEANHWLSHLGDDRRIRGTNKRSSVWRDHDSHRVPDAFICRTNAGMVRQMLTLQAEGVDVSIVGEAKTRGILRMAEVSEQLTSRHFTTDTDFASFKDWDEVVAFANTPECPPDIAGQVQLVQQFGSDTMRRAVKRASQLPAEQAQCVLTTCHQAKGRQWRHVRIADDFTEALEPGVRKKAASEEFMVAYVAVTRAQRHLDARAIAGERGNSHSPEV